MTRRALLAGLCIGTAVLVGCGARHEEHATGVRVISLAPSVTRILDAIGAGPLLVGVDEVSRQVPGLGSLPSVGGLFSPDMERMVALEPSLVIAVRTEQQRALLGQLRSRGVRVEEIAPYTLDEVLGSFVEIARWVEREAEGRSLVTRVRGDLEAVRRSVEGSDRPTTVLVVERDPLYVVGAGSFAHELIEIAGGVNVFEDLPAPYPRVSLEVLAHRAPEVILDTGIGSGADGEDARAARRFWSRFTWVKRVETVPRGPLTIPGPELAAAARGLAGRLHPGAARVP